MELKIRIAIGKALDANPGWRNSLHTVETQELLASAVGMSHEFIRLNIVYIGRL